MGNETAAAPAELLTAISGPEEDLEELAKPVQGKQMDEQVSDRPIETKPQALLIYG